MDKIWEEGVWIAFSFMLAYDISFFFMLVLLTDMALVVTLVT